MNPLKKVLISGFIIFNFFAMIRCHLNFESKFVSSFYKPIDKYLSFFSIYQDWVMFSPDPSRQDIFITAKVEFDDGSSAPYEFEYLPENTFLQKYQYAERLRKFTSEGLRRDDHQFMWKDAAKFALRKVKDKNFRKLPVRVHLFRHWAETANLATEFVPHNHIKTNYSSFRFYTYEVI